MGIKKKSRELAGTQDIHSAVSQDWGNYKKNRDTI